MLQAFEVSNNLKTGKDTLALRIPLPALKLFIEDMQTPLSYAEREGKEDRAVEVRLSGSILSFIS